MMMNWPRVYLRFRRQRKDHSVRLRDSAGYRQCLWKIQTRAMALVVRHHGLNYNAVH